jgi:hypothetical protein
VNIDTSDRADEEVFERIKRQNDDMYNKLKFSYSSQLASPSYKNYLENQEKRHSQQIAEIYAHNSRYTSQLSEKISQLVAEKTDLERRLLLDTKDLEGKCNHVEIKYKTDTSQLNDALQYEKIRNKDLLNEIELLKK